MDATQAKQIAETTLSQFGGRRALVMIGGSASSESSGALHIRFQARNPKGWKAVKLTLDPSDTYTMTFFRIANVKGIPTVKKREIDGLYCDGLRSAFEQETGLYLSL